MRLNDLHIKTTDYSSYTIYVGFVDVDVHVVFNVLFKTFR